MSRDILPPFSNILSQLGPSFICSSIFTYTVVTILGDIHICKNSAVSLTPLSQNHLFFCFCEVVSQKLWFCFFMIKTYLDHWAYFLLIWWDSRFPRNYLAILYLRKQVKLTPQCHWQSNFFYHELCYKKVDGGTYLQWD